MGAYVNGVYVPTLAETGWDDEVNDLLAALGRSHIDVTLAPYGAAVDGATNDTDAVNAAVDDVYAAGGGVVSIPAGTCMANVVIKPKVRLVGAGRNATVLKSPAGSNGDVIKGVNFDTLTGKVYAAGDYARGAYECGVENMTIDGNKANNVGGYGIRIWGRALQFHNIAAQNCDDDGIWTEFTSHDNGNVDNEPGGYFTNIWTTNNGNNGWTFRGPHDSQIDNLTTWGNTSGWGLRSETVIGSYNGSVGHCKAWNSWLNANSFYFDTGPGAIHGITASAGNTGTGIELAAASGSGKFSDADIAGHDIGLILRGTNHTFQGLILRNTLGIEVASGGYCAIDISAAQNDTLIAFGGALGNNRYNVSANISTGTLFTGTPHVSDLIDVTFVDDVRAQGWQRGALLATDALPASDDIVEGATLWDSTLHQPVWWDGAKWQHTRPVTALTIADGTALPDGKGGLGAFSNLLKYSEQFDQATWTKDFGASTPPTITADTATPPTGSGSAADTYTTGTPGGSANALDQLITSLGALGDRTFTASMYVKGTAASDGIEARLRITDHASENTFGIYYGSVVLDQTRWQRISFTYTFSSGNVNSDIQLIFYLLSGDTVGVYVWGAQLTETDDVAIYTRSVAAAVAETIGLSLTVDKGLFGGGIGVGNAVAATESIGKAVTKKIEVFDASGASIGYVPVYTSIT